MTDQENAEDRGDDDYLYEGDDCAGCGAEKTVKFGGQQWCKECAPWADDDESDEAGAVPSEEQTALARWSA